MNRLNLFLGTFLLVSGTVGVSGCVGESETMEFIDEGVVCFNSEDGSSNIEPGEPLLVTVEWQGCMSSSCDSNEEAECTATVVDGRIEVTSRFSYVHEETYSGCTDDCWGMTAECEIESVEAGDYDVFLGTVGIGEYSIPYEDGELCFD